MQYRKLGNDGPEVSVLSFGAWQLGDPAYWGDDPDTDCEATVQTAIDGGINLFDTAEGYADGESERVLGKALGAKRKDVLIASKVSSKHCSAKGIREACEASLKRLGTDCIDLYQIHWPFRDEPFQSGYGETVDGVGTFEDAWTTLAALRFEGKIRYIGVSNFGAKDLSDWLGAGEAVSNQIGYNMLFRAPEYAVTTRCRQQGIGVLAYAPLMQGLLSGRYATLDDVPENRRRTRHFSSSRSNVRHDEPGCEPALNDALADISHFAEAIGVPLATVSLCWVIAQTGVSSAIIGARKPAQLLENLKAGDLDIGPAAIAQLNEMAFPVKRYLGRNPDMWQSGDAARIR